MTTRRERMGWAGLIIVTILITRITTLYTPLIDDEETFTVIARLLLHGGTPYVDFIDNKPPLLYYWYALWLGLFGETNMLALHLIGMVWVGLTCWVIAAIGRRVYSAQAGCFAALCYAIFTTTYVPPYIALHASLILALPFCLSVHLLLKWFDHGRTLWLFLSGIMTATAVMIKYQALLQIPFMMWAFVYLIYRRRPPRDAEGSSRLAIGRAVLRGFFVYLLGVGLVLGLVLWDMHRIGALSDFYQHTWKSSLAYMKLGETVGDFWQRTLFRAGTYLLATFPLWILLINQLVSRIAKYLNGHPIDRPYSSLIWGWFWINIPAVLAGGRFYSHYFIQLLPPLCMIAGIQLSRLWTGTVGESLKRLQCTHRMIVSVLAICALIWIPTRLFFQPLAERFNAHNLKAEKEIGQYIQTHSTPTDRLFVWGTDPAIFFFAERDPATRFLWVDSLVGRVPGVPETQMGTVSTDRLANPRDWGILFHDLAKRPPDWVIDCASGNLRDYAKFPISHYPLFQDYLSRNYVKDATIAGIDLYHRNPP